MRKESNDMTENKNAVLLQMAKTLFSTLLKGKLGVFQRIVRRPISHLAFHHETEEEMICR